MTSSGYNIENKHFLNYMYVLRLLRTIMIKIDGDLDIAKIEEDESGNRQKRTLHLR